MLLENPQFLRKNQDVLFGADFSAIFDTLFLNPPDEEKILGIEAP